jgi:hypothetical protein
VSSYLGITGETLSRVRSEIRISWFFLIYVNKMLGH